MHLWSLLPVPKNATLCSIVNIVYLKVTIIYRYIFSWFWDPKHFTGIKFCDFHATMQTLAPPRACAQWVARKLSKKIYAASTIEQLMTTATYLSLSCTVWENVINTGPRLYTRYFQPFMKEIIPTIDMLLPQEEVCQVLLSWQSATFLKRCQGLHVWCS